MQEKGMEEEIIAIKALANGGDDSLIESEESEEL